LESHIAVKFIIGELYYFVLHIFKIYLIFWLRSYTSHLSQDESKGKFHITVTLLFYFPQNRNFNKMIFFSKKFQKIM